MGAGKTTFTKAVCECLGVEDVINSPTFAIVNEYRSDSGELIYHSTSTVSKTGRKYTTWATKTILQRALCFIEWPELVEELLPGNTVKVTIEENEDGSRTVSF